MSVTDELIAAYPTLNTSSTSAATMYAIGAPAPLPMAIITGSEPATAVRGAAAAITRNTMPATPIDPFNDRDPLSPVTGDVTMGFSSMIVLCLDVARDNRATWVGCLRAFDSTYVESNAVMEVTASAWGPTSGKPLPRVAGRTEF
ncbi:hypothetical protein GCM10022238_21880 [Gordonia hankookensis]